jgi:4,5-dihydroxyphthalate decarboxylase
MEKLYETNALAVMAPFIVFDIERTRELMGLDYWPFGIDPNRKSVSTFVRYLREQEIIARNIDISELFIDIATRR